ncbi:MAG TPA: DUF2752 domain-containing protein [Bacteroidales bacterium]|nr:DUF2752 domain-containing protein [Bacteroidales bacterium]HPS72677.1 DUF2752 domain-containing protein [Bacteroidales bacterium]
MSRVIEWLEQHQAPCSWKEHFGVECPGCGMQRAFIELLKGNLWNSICLYPALIPLMVLLIYTFLHLLINFRKGALVIKILFIFTVFLMFIHFMYNIII